MNATAFPGAYGWQYFSNETSFSFFQGVKSVYEMSADGIAWIFAQFFILFLTTYIIYVKTQNIFIAMFSQLLMTMVLAHYDLLDPTVGIISYVTVVVTIGASVAYYWLKKGGG